MDTIEEVFRETGLPESMPSEEKFITSFDGCLSLILQNPSSQCYKVWTMKEFGVTESWTKLYTTTVFTNGFLQCWPLGATIFGEVLFVKCFYFGLRFCLPSYVVSYDARRSEFEEFKVEVDSDCSNQFIPYVESLVSVLGVPKCGFRTRPVLDPPEKQTGGSMIKWAKSRFHKLRTSLSHKVLTFRMESNPLWNRLPLISIETTSIYDEISNGSKYVKHFLECFVSWTIFLLKIKSFFFFFI